MRTEAERTGAERERGGEGRKGKKKRIGFYKFCLFWISFTAWAMERWKINELDKTVASTP